MSHPLSTIDCTAPVVAWILVLQTISGAPMERDQLAKNSNMLPAAPLRIALHIAEDRRPAENPRDLIPNSGSKWNETGVFEGDQDIRTYPQGCSVEIQCYLLTMESWRCF